MPIEIKELHIKVTVNQPSSSEQSVTAGPPSADDKEALVRQCVEQVMGLMNNKQER